MPSGIVTRSTGSWYEVRNEAGETVKCRIRGKFKLKGLKLTNPVAVGDYVIYEGEKEETLITKILPRTNYVVRQSPRQKHNLHLLAANVDQAILVVTIVEPMLKLGFIDRFLLMTEPHDIPVIIVFNKSDIYGTDELEVFEALKYIYEKIGYEVLLTSAKTSDHVSQLRNCLSDKISLIAGQSGVGKSSLLNVLSDTLDLRTKVISDYTGKGQHTTTFAEMIYLDEHSAIIDTPGIKTLSFNNLEVEDVAHNFREFFKVSPQCKFGNCTHRNEPKCAVKEAVEKNEISILRYQNYLVILDEIEAQNYWERNTDY